MELCPRTAGGMDGTNVCAKALANAIMDENAIITAIVMRDGRFMFLSQ